MGRGLTRGHTAGNAPVIVTGAPEALPHLVLGIEGLDYAEAAEGFVQLRHYVRPLALGPEGLFLQGASEGSHSPGHQRHHGESEEGKLPAHRYQGSEIDDYQYRILQQHIQRTHYRVLNLAHVTAHPGHYVALALVGEEAQRQAHKLVVNLGAQVPHHAGAQRDHNCGGPEVARALDQGHRREEQAYQKQGAGFPGARYQLLAIGVEVVDNQFLETKVGTVPRNMHVLGCVHLEEYLQDGYDQ